MLDFVDISVIWDMKLGPGGGGGGGSVWKQITKCETWRLADKGGRVTETGEGGENDDKMDVLSDIEGQMQE